MQEIKPTRYHYINRDLPPDEDYAYCTRYDVKLALDMSFSTNPRIRQMAQEIMQNLIEDGIKVWIKISERPEGTKYTLNVGELMGNYDYGIWVIVETLPQYYYDDIVAFIKKGIIPKALFTDKPDGATKL